MSHLYSTPQRSTDLMFMLGLSEVIDQLAMANSVCWYGHVLRREDGHMLRRGLVLRLMVRGRKESWRGHGKAG